jgi:hypothetical protein
MDERKKDPTLASYGRLGAAVMHSRNDGHRVAANARAAFEARFAREVDPDGVLPEGERRRRAMHARRAHFQRMAIASAKARARGAHR